MDNETFKTNARALRQQAEELHRGMVICAANGAHLALTPEQTAVMIFDLHMRLNEAYSCVSKLSVILEKMEKERK